MNDSETRLSGGEYWILSACVEGRWPLAYLKSPKLDEIVNRKAHGLAADELRDTVGSLLSRQLIAVVRSCGDFGDVVLDPASALRALHDESGGEPDCACFGLTTRGGEAWETFTRPDWSRFVLEENYSDEEGAWFTCMSEEWLREFCAAFSAFRGTCSEALRLQSVPPWSATYWKNLPHGFRAWLPPEQPISNASDLERRNYWLLRVSLMRRSWCETGL
jgi:hypothetical protein